MLSHLERSLPLASTAPHCPGSPAPSPVMFLLSFLVLHRRYSSSLFFWPLPLGWWVDSLPQITLSSSHSQIVPFSHMSRWISYKHLKQLTTSLLSVSPCFWLPTSPLVLGYHYLWPEQYPSNWPFCFYSYSFRSLLNSTSRMLFLNFIMLLLCLKHFNISRLPMCKSQHSQYGNKSFVIWVPTSLSGFIVHLLLTSALQFSWSTCVFPGPGADSGPSTYELCHAGQGSWPFWVSVPSSTKLGW